MAMTNLHLLLFALCQARSKDQHQHCARRFLKKKQAVQPSQSLIIRGSQVVGPKWLRQCPKLLYFLHAHQLLQQFPLNATALGKYPQPAQSVALHQVCLQVPLNIVACTPRQHVQKYAFPSGLLLRP